MSKKNGTDGGHVDVQREQVEGTNYFIVPMCETHNRMRDTLGWVTFKSDVAFARVTRAEQASMVQMGSGVRPR